MTRAASWLCVAVGCACAVALTAGGWMVATELSSTLRATADAERAIARAADELPGKVLPSLTQEVDELGKLIVARADAQMTGLRGDVMPRVDKMEADLSNLGAIGISSLNQQLGTANTSISALVGATTPVLASAAILTANYAALPDRLGAELRPSWLSIQPEITCRQADGSGYGGCWHGRVTGLMGEALRVGGVFTQHFPELITSWQGIQHDVNGWTNKYVMPHKLTTWGKIQLGLNLGKDVGIAGLRGGAF